MSRENSVFNRYAIEYDPIKVGSIDGKSCLMRYTDQVKNLKANFIFS